MTTNKSKRSKHWCVTVNNPKFELDSYWNPALFSFLIVGEEFGAQHETPHHQIYCCFINRKYLSGCKKAFPRGHCGIKFGTILEASTYCKKDGKYLSFGILPVSAQEANKNKWDGIRDAAKSGSFDLIPSDVYVKHYGNLKKIRQDHPDKKDCLEYISNVWIHAPTGFGKSYYARHQWPDYFDKDPNKWWDGYRDQATVILDDISPMDCRFLGRNLKRWADEYPFNAQEKGSSKVIRPQRIIVTSQYSIAECFPYDFKIIKAMERRFAVCYIDKWDGSEYNPYLPLE